MALEEAARLRDKDNEILSIDNNEVTSLACGSPANSIALFNGTNKRSFSSKSSICRSYRTGRWTSEESAFTDQLIKAFDAGLLPLPHGIKLNDFLCDLLSCRTSRLTKKLKNAKLSARTYRSCATGKTMGAFSTNHVGGDIQRAQTLFLKTITPEWVRMELQFNISRMWRTHLANLSLQVSYTQLETKEWFASLDAIDCIAMPCSKTEVQARRKRLKSALAEDINTAAKTTQTSTEDTSSNGNDASSEVSFTSSDKEGVFVGGLPFHRLSNFNLKSMADEDEKANALSVSTDIGIEDKIFQYRVSMNGSIAKESSVNRTSLRKFSFESTVLERSMKPSTSMSSFVELFSTPELQPNKPSSRRASLVDFHAPSIDVVDSSKQEKCGISDSIQRPDAEADNIIVEAIDSVLESSVAGNDSQGLFLKEISKFLTESNSPFQHVDLWVPMDVSHSNIVAGTKHIGGSSKMATTSSTKVTGIIYGGQQAPSLRLSNAGCITVGREPQIVNRLNEFGNYSKNFSFSPGFGMPGRVYLSRVPCWENNLSLLKPDKFARSGGASIYGVNTALCIPVFTPVGQMVVSLYSTQNLARDVNGKRWEKICMEFFWKLKPEPKWKLTIDVGLKSRSDDVQEMHVSQTPVSSPRMVPVKNQSFLIPQSPTSTKSQHVPIQQTSALDVASNLSLGQKKLGVAPPVVPSCSDESSLALLVGKYLPHGHLDRAFSESHLPASSLANNCNVADCLRSLHLLLLRHSSRRTNAESKMVEIIMGTYQTYLRANKKEHDLILTIVNDWKGLLMLSSSISEAQAKKPLYSASRAVTQHNSWSP